MTNISNTILTGLRVLEIGNGTAIGWCGRMFLDFGASVSFLDSTGLNALEMEETFHEEQKLNKHLQTWLNSGKSRHTDLDYKSFDILILSETVQGFTPPDLEDVFILNISWFRNEGSYSGWTGSDIIIQALAGTIFPVGPKDEMPVFTGETEASIIGGTYSFIAGLVSILEKRGKAITEVSILEANLILGELQSSDSIRFGKPNSREGINRFFPTCPLGIYKCKDGWIGATVITVPQWKSFCELLEIQDLFYKYDLDTIQKRSESIDFLETKIREKLILKNAEDWAKLGMEKRIPMVKVPSPSDLQSHSVFNNRKALVDYKINGKNIKVPNTPICQFLASKENEMPVVLKRFEEILIVDFSMGWAGPLATRILSDLGVEVIKVEAGTYPDWWRATQFTKSAIDNKQFEESRRFAALNRGKKSISIDLKTDEGLKVVLELISKADIVIENQADGVMEKLGLSQRVLKQSNPNLTFISMTAFGSGNELSSTRAYGSTLEHASGTPCFRGRPEWPPMMAHIAYGDPIGGLYGAAALLVSIFNKRKKGGFLFINISLTECLLPFAANGLLNYSKRDESITRAGNRHSVHCPHGIFKTINKDENIAISVETQSAWESLCEIITNDPNNFLLPLTQTQRKKKEYQIEGLLTNWLNGKRAISVVDKLQKIGVAAAIVKQPEKSLEDECLNKLHFFYETERPYVGSQRQVGLPFNNKRGKRYDYTGDAPLLGADTRNVLKEKLGYEEKEVEKLFENGISTLKPVEKKN